MAASSETPTPKMALAWFIFHLRPGGEFEYINFLQMAFLDLSSRKAVHISVYLVANKAVIYRFYRALVYLERIATGTFIISRSSGVGACYQKI